MDFCKFFKTLNLIYFNVYLIDNIKSKIHLINILTAVFHITAENETY